MVFLLGSQYQNSLLGQPLFIRRNHFAKDRRARRRRRGVGPWGGEVAWGKDQGQSTSLTVLEGAGGQSGALSTQREVSSGKPQHQGSRLHGAAPPHLLHEFRLCWKVQEDRAGHYYTAGRSTPGSHSTRAPGYMGQHLLTSCMNLM